MWKGLKLHKVDYAVILAPLVTAAPSFQLFSLLRHQLVWMANTRPDLLVPTNILSQVTASPLSPAYVQTIKIIQRRVANNGDLGLTFARLDVDSLHLVVYSDDSFG